MFYLLLLVLLIPLYYCGRLYFTQRSIIFRPSPQVYGSPDEFHINFENLRLECRSGIKIHGWWMPGSINKAIIFFHGTIGNLTYDLRTIAFLHSLGASLLSIDYPGYGESEGKASEQGCYEAAEAAWNFVCDTKGFKGEDVILFGKSLGGAVATYLAANHKCGGLVLHSGFTSIPDMAAHIYPYLPVRLFCHSSMNALKYVTRSECALLLMHSETDEFIPIKQAHRIYEKAASPKHFIRLKGSHFSDSWQVNPKVYASLKELVYNGSVSENQQTSQAPQQSIEFVKR
jgi:pimeloyl-ACP methyl ester carboxylesterase